MNKASRQTQGQTKPNPLQASGILQRKCACGNHTVATGECSECAKKEHSLQRRTSNHAKPNRDTLLSRTLPMQRKLTIGKSDDPLEQEADQIADQVLAALSNSAINTAPPRIQRVTGSTAGKNDIAPPSVDRVLTSPGRLLEPSLRQDMEQRFGYDFSGVRVHSDTAAEQSARDVNANAYTMGNNVIFGAGHFPPSTHEGRRLIAHELTHVVQQNTQLSQYPPNILRRKESDQEEEGTREPATDTAPHVGNTPVTLSNPSRFRAEPLLAQTAREYEKDHPSARRDYQGPTSVPWREDMAQVAGEQGFDPTKYQVEDLVFQFGPNRPVFNNIDEAGKWAQVWVYIYAEAERRLYESTKPGISNQLPVGHRIEWVTIFHRTRQGKIAFTTPIPNVDTNVPGKGYGGTSSYTKISRHFGIGQRNIVGDLHTHPHKPKEGPEFVEKYSEEFSGMEPGQQDGDIQHISDGRAGFLSTPSGQLLKAQILNKEFWIGKRGWSRDKLDISTILGAETRPGKLWKPWKARRRERGTEPPITKFSFEKAVDWVMKQARKNFENTGRHWNAPWPLPIENRRRRSK